MTCSMCMHWAGIGGGFGRCHAHPPTIVASMVPAAMAVDQIAAKLAAATQWPMTEGDDYCGDYAEPSPC